MGSFPSTLKNTTGESRRTCTKWNHRIGRTPSSFWLIQVYQICSNHDCSRLKGYNMLQPSSSVFEFEDLGEVQIRFFERNLPWKWMEIAYHGSRHCSWVRLLCFPVQLGYTKYHQIYLTIGKHPLSYDVLCFIESWVVPLELVRDVNHLSKTPTTM